LFAVNIGQQPNSDVWGFGPDVQLDIIGALINEDQQFYVLHNKRVCQNAYTNIAGKVDFLITLTLLLVIKVLMIIE